MATGDVGRLLADLDHFHQQQLEMWQTLSDFDKEVSDEFLKECESIAQLLDTKLKELQAISLALSRDDWSAVLTECREKGSTTLVKLLEWLAPRDWAQLQQSRVGTQPPVSRRHGRDGE